MEPLTWTGPLGQFLACAAPSVSARCRCAPSTDDAPLRRFDLGDRFGAPT